MFIALSGGSYAVAALSGADKKVVKRITNAQISKRAPGLSVEQAGSANSATNAGHATSADSADLLDGLDSGAFLRRGAAAGAAAAAGRVLFLRDGRVAGEVEGGSAQHVADSFTCLEAGADGAIPGRTGLGRVAGLIRDVLDRAPRR